MSLRTKTREGTSSTEGRLGIRRICEPQMIRHLAIVKPEYRPSSCALVAKGILMEELRRMPISPEGVAVGPA
jgi:hypothetical protein